VGQTADTLVIYRDPGVPPLQWVSSDPNWRAAARSADLEPVAALPSAHASPLRRRGEGAAVR